MEFNINHPLLYVLVAAVIAVVLAQSVFFLVKAWKRGVQLGIDKKKLRKIATTAAVFTVAPAVSIVIGVLTLSKQLGVALPWLRLSVVGSLSYEMLAASNTLGAMGLSAVTTPNASQYVTVALVMTISIMVGIWLVPVLCKRLQSGMSKLEKRDKKWADVFQSALFLGMISAFVGIVFCDFSDIFVGEFKGLIPVLVMLVSAVVMVICGVLSKKVEKARWLADYALPASLVLGMASAIPLTAWLG